MVCMILYLGHNDLLRANVGGGPLPRLLLVQLGHGLARRAALGVQGRSGAARERRLLHLVYILLVAVTRPLRLRGPVNGEVQRQGRWIGCCAAVAWLTALNMVEISGGALNGDLNAPVIERSSILMMRDHVADHGELGGRAGRLL